MNRIFVWVGLAAVLAAGCWDEGSGVHSIVVEQDELTWPAAGVLNLDVFTPSGAIEISVGDGDTIYASVDRQCKSGDRADAEAHVDDITVDGSLAGDTFTIAAEMPETEKREYFADFHIGAPMVERVELVTGEGDIEILGSPGNIEAKNSWGGIKCKLDALPDGRWVILDGRRTDVVVMVPEDVSAVFDIRTTYGALEVEGFDSVTYTDEKVYRKAGYIGGGGATILITTVMGSVRIEAREAGDFDN